MHTDPAAVSLDDKYTADSGRVLISGIQALVRLTLEQRRLDESRGLDTRAFVSGYQGSPLGGLDMEMGRAKRFLDPEGVVFQAGLNEELAATAVAGTQLLRQVPGRRHDGVTGFWYGKNPGLDRAADAIRHGNIAGTAPLGGAVAWIGDDPGNKSSTIPSASEQMCQSLAMPLLAPSSVPEIIEFGLHAVALSRAVNLWAGLKIVADIADASATVDLGALGHGVPVPGTADRAPAQLLGRPALDAEFDVLTRRLDLARAYGTTHGLNKVTFSARRATTGVVASGLAHAVVLRALEDMGIDEGAMEALGLRLVRVGMPHPLDQAHLASMLEGLDEVVVVEDKTPFLEAQVKEAMYRRPDAPLVVGRRDDSGRPLLTVRGTLSATDVARALGRRIGQDRLPESAAAYLRTADPRRSRIELPTIAARTPYFCSGCPHNTSTRADDDTLVGAGIGCHVMVLLDGEGRGHQVGVTQMGGEGAQWNGLAPFTDDRHFVQNLGDGTFHHSGSLAIRASVAAGVNVTYKLLYNDAVAMTGGQRAEGKLDIPTLTRWLATEGVRRVVVTTAEPGTYRGVALDPIATVRHRDDFADVQRELAAVEGVTVLVHDDRCAAEERRLRKRGALPTPAERVVINERVCEGCGDCGDKSTCLSVQPVETEFGRKTRIHQASCNSDFTCLKGDCPSFLLVEPGTRARRAVPALPVELTAPAERPRSDGVLMRMPGIGGTGVVTVSQILQMAAHMDGLHAAGLEQTGVAQKGGPVVSDVRISKQPVAGALRASKSTVDVLIGFDLLGAAAEQNLETAAADRTIALVNTAVVPTAAMVTNRVPVPGSPQDALDRIAAATAEQVLLDAQGMADALFGDHMPVNMLMIGAAFQRGCLPMSAEAIERAIRLNGAAVDTNLAAFRWGRAAVVDRDAVERALAPQERAVVEVDATARRIAGDAAGELGRVLATRVADLVGYQDEAYAQRYAREVRRVAGIARERAGEEGGERVAVAYAKGLHKLMAYKDEYEVARLHLDTVEKARLGDEFGAGASVSVLLHPPVLRALGMKRKIRLRRTAEVAFRALRSARRLRGTRLDVFGYAKVRRVERELVGEYRRLVERALDRLGSGTAEQVAAIAELTELVRGYEDIKLAGVERFRERAAEQLSALAARADVDDLAVKS
ncbi:indolepyruvate ferredoxin oxidoreductase [Saccharopolyspora erythraea NRRL 2338]|uniref:Indolepyruvate ferredoxin oxidoreductase alpha and beta subunit n=4 Tax=Saccharopolyspora erythraea TaxID=1836 RepID=A4FH19_SACEN|nr:indolepyruvate ferredoxin oxidoreductase [Saccharopolyspora erythraea NRRL 2338]QRK87253.1 indolepyruvate ferredoxin oxidoreductase family protein [Saccharopolyspora erythraea]CAM03344.1 indolepyruvate ferredoxin oxidoreductase alpha and beta subunit [Saccharopolyspora erythraea NRRL 2338]